MRHLRFTAVAATLTVVLGGCDGQYSDTSSATSALGASRVATVNGKPVPESLFRLYSLSGLQRNADDLTEDERELILGDLVRLQLLADAAEQRGLANERTIAAELELQRLQFMARSMAVRYLEDNPATETELRAAYDANLDSFRATQYRARHILLEDEANAAEVIAELSQGADFAELARDRSTGPTGPEGGDLGWFSADSMVEPFADAVSGMAVGTYSTVPVQTQFGWHVISLEETRDQQPPGLDAVRNDIRALVDRQKLESYVNGLQAGAEVVLE